MSEIQSIQTPYNPLVQLREEIYELGQEINWAIMRLVWIDAPKYMYRTTLKAKQHIDRIYRKYANILLRMAAQGNDQAMAILGAIDQIKELLGYTEEELERSKEPMAELLTWLARAQQDVLFMLKALS